MLRRFFSQGLLGLELTAALPRRLATDARRAFGAGHAFSVRVLSPAVPALEVDLLFGTFV